MIELKNRKMNTTAVQVQIGNKRLQRDVRKGLD